jgi:uncharacterized protein
MSTVFSEKQRPDQEAIKRLLPKRLEWTERHFALKRWPTALNGFRMVQLSDTHLDWYNIQNLTQVVQAVNAAQPDLIVLTGDYINSDKSHVQRAVDIFSELKAPWGVFVMRLLKPISSS